MSDRQVAVTQPRSGGEATVVRSSTDVGLASGALPVHPTQRNVLSLLLFLGTCAWFWIPLRELWSFAVENEQFSHVMLIPWVSLYLLFLNRTTVLTSKDWNPTAGALLLGGGAFAYWAVEGQDWTPDRLAVAIAAFVLTCWGVVLAWFGGTCVRKNSFPLLFLLFMVPLPPVILDVFIGFLQRSSTEVSDVLFSLFGVPIVREGFVFSLSQFTIYVAEECSGIRSFLSLVITSLLAGYWFLETGWARVGLVVLVVPLAIAKNAMRIVGLALLANYVDPAFITNSPLHRSGGIPLFLLSLIVLICLAWLLRRWESRPASKDGSVRGEHG